MHINTQFSRTIRFDIKRCFKLLPGLLLTTLLFLFAAGILLHYYTPILFGEEPFQQVNVALYMPEDSGYNQMGLSMVSNMKSFQDSLNIIQTDTYEEGYAMLVNKEAAAFIVIPEGFISSILNGNNNPIRILLNGTKTFETYVVNDLLQNAAALLGTAQAAVYSVYDISVQYGLDHETNIAFQNQIDTVNMTYVLARESIFSEENFDLLHAFSLTEQLAASFLLLILFMTCFILTAFYKGNNDAYYIRQKISGIGKGKLLISNCLAASIDIYVVYIMIFAGLLIMGLHPTFLSLLTILPVILIVSLFIGLISEFVSGPHMANLIIFLMVLLLLYLAGGILPLQLMPKFLQHTAGYNPMTWLIQYTLHTVF